MASLLVYCCTPTTSKALTPKLLWTSKSLMLQLQHTTSKSILSDKQTNRQLQTTTTTTTTTNWLTKHQSDHYTDHHSVPVVDEFERIAAAECDSPRICLVRSIFVTGSRTRQARKHLTYCRYRDFHHVMPFVQSQHYAVSTGSLQSWRRQSVRHEIFSYSDKWNSHWPTLRNRRQCIGDKPLREFSDSAPLPLRRLPGSAPNDSARMSSDAVVRTSLSSATVAACISAFVNSSNWCDCCCCIFGSFAPVVVLFFPLFSVAAASVVAAAALISCYRSVAFKFYCRRHDWNLTMTSFFT